MSVKLCLQTQQSIHIFLSFHTASPVQNSFCSALKIGIADHQHAPLSNKVGWVLVRVYVRVCMSVCVCVRVQSTREDQTHSACLWGRG